MKTTIEKQTDKKYRAIILGGTGSVGTYLINKLIKSPLCSKITVISRRELPPSPKLNVIIWNNFDDALLTHPEKAATIFEGHDVLFCSLGASREKAIGLIFNKKKYAPFFKKIDYQYVIEAAIIANKVGVPYFYVVSSMGANPTSGLFILQIKGEMEAALQEINFKGLSIFRPSQLMRDLKDTSSFIEWIGLSLFILFNRFIPDKHKGIHVETIAEAMKNEFEQRMKGQMEKVIIYPSDIMQKSGTNSSK